MNAAAWTRAKAPFFHSLCSDWPPHDQARDWERSIPGLVARVVRGEKSTTKAALMNEIGAALQLPFFGENWDALNDVLCDHHLYAGPLVVVFSHADLVLSSGPGTGLKQLVDVLQTSAASLASVKPARPRHYVLHESGPVRPSTFQRWQTAGAEIEYPRGRRS